MPAKVTVIVGPARAGKTSILLAQYRRVLAEAGFGEALWLSPNRRSAEQVRSQLLDTSLKGCFSPQIITFAQFAELVLARSEAPVRPINGFLKRQLIQRVIEDCAADGKLTYFGPIADATGLVDLVAAFISELKRLEIWPEEFEQSCRARGLAQKDRELLLVYTGYQRLLTEHQLYDDEGRFWSARALLRDGQGEPVKKLGLVVADGFTDFTRTQHEILQILAQRSADLVISLPGEPATTRRDLFAKSLSTLAELRRRHPALEVQELPRAEISQWPAMAHLESEVFGDPRIKHTAPDTKGFEILAAAGQLGEIELIATRIKELLVQGDGRGPASPSEIGVVARSLTDIGPLAREVFSQRGIPVAIEGSPALSQSPAMAFLLGLLRLEVEGWPFRQLLSLTASNYFQPDWAEFHPQAVAACESTIRLLQIPSGRDILLERTERLANRPPRQSLEEDADDYWSIEDERNRQAAGAALPLLRKLAELLDRLPRKANSARWAVALAELAQHAGLLRAIDADQDARRANRDRSAYERLIATLRSIDRIAGWLGEEPRLFNRSEFVELLDDVLRWEQLPAEYDEVGKVRVLSATSARGLDFAYLFFAGLSERAFPPADGDHGLYTDREYQDLNRAGLCFSVQAERHQQEMLLFYEVLTRATKRIYLSYPAFDDKAQPLSPSPFLAEVQRACGDTKLTQTEVRDLSPIPTAAEPIGPAEFRAKAVSLAVKGDPALLAGLVASEPAPGLGDSLLSGLSVTAERGSRGGFGPFEGILSTAAAEKLAAHYGSEHCWSASQLEQYAGCPHRFFLDKVLKLPELNDLALEVDYMTRGRIMHDALAAVHRKLSAASPCSPVRNEEVFRQSFLETLEPLLAEASQGSPLAEALRHIDRQLLVKWAAQYLDQHRRYDDCWSDCDEALLPAHFEVSFGPSRRDAEPDPLSLAAPFELKHAGETIKFAGRIDRIDVGKVNGRAVFNVLDYKTGGSSRFHREAIEAGRALQLPLYALAVQDLLLADQEAVPWRIGYWYIKTQGFKHKDAVTLYQKSGQELQPSDDWVGLRAVVLDRVVSLARGIREAQFPMHSADETCTSRCQFSTVCRVHQVRALEKTWEAPSPQIV